MKKKTPDPCTPNPRTHAPWIPGSVHPELVANLTQPYIKATSLHELTTHGGQAFFQRCKAGEESENRLTEFATGQRSQNPSVEGKNGINWTSTLILKYLKRMAADRHSPYLVRSSCRGLTAPRMSGWGTWMLPHVGPRHPGNFHCLHSNREAVASATGRK